MKTRGAVLLEVPGRYEVVELDVDDPRAGEIRVRMVATGLCHSDDHHATGDMKVGILPFAGGHEGAGIVEAVGPHTEGFAEGDHVVFSFLPSCGKLPLVRHRPPEPLRPRRLARHQRPLGGPDELPALPGRQAGRADVRPVDLLRAHHRLRRTRR